MRMCNSKLNRSYLYNNEKISESHAIRVNQQFASPMHLRAFVLQGASDVERRIMTNRGMSGNQLPEISPVRYTVDNNGSTVHVMAWASIVVLAVLLDRLDGAIDLHSTPVVTHAEAKTIQEYTGLIAIKNRISDHKLAHVVKACLNKQSFLLGLEPLAHPITITNVQQLDKRHFKGLHHKITYHHRFKYITFKSKDRLVGQWSVGHLISNGFGAIEVC